MKKLTNFLIFCLALSLCLPLFACDGDKSDYSSEESEDVTTDASTEKDAENPLDDGLFHIISKSASNAKIIYSERASEYEKQLAETLRDLILQKTGISLDVGSDYVSKVEDANSKDAEILVGLTNRPESVKLNSELDHLTFAIQSTENKLVIVGKNVALLSLAIDRFANEIMESDRVSYSKGALSIDADVKYISPPAEPTLKNYMNNSLTFECALEKVGSVSTDGDAKILGGACHDGEYFYALMRSPTLDLTEMSYKCTLLKYEFPSFNFVAKSEEFYAGLGASVDYDPSQDRLVILHSSITGKEKVSYMTTKLLRVTQTVELSRNLDALCYAGDGSFIACDSENKKMFVLDSTFSVKESYDLRLLGGDIASVTTDGLYVYVLTNSKTMLNVYSTDGEYVNRISVDTLQEAKNICCYNGALYVGFCDALWSQGEIYELKFSLKE